VVLPQARYQVSELAGRGHDVVWLTGRPERCRRDTVRWLARNGLPAGELYMRGNGDRQAGQRRLPHRRLHQQVDQRCPQSGDHDGEQDAHA
jgi:hypothetical protein